MLNMSTVIEQKTAYSKTLYLKWVKSFWREMIETEIDSGCFILFSCFFWMGVDGFSKATSLHVFCICQVCWSVVR